MFLTGCILLTAFTLASGFAQTGLALIAFRALSGVSASFCLPSAVSIITGVFAPGRGRNIAFACLGAAQPLGFSIGLFVGGVLVQTIGWRFAYWIVPGGNTVIAGLAVWNLPGDRWEGRRVVALRLAREVDWVGAGIASLGLGLLSYVLA
jgi:MFS family permease